MQNTTSRLTHCWRHQDCTSCLHSPYTCGWCPSSSTCIPATSLLSPLTHPGICPLASERFELRTRALGCGCSTTTFLSVVVTVVATLVAVLVVCGVWRAVGWGVRTFGVGRGSGWEIRIEGDGRRREGRWLRRGWGRKVRAWSWRRGWGGGRSEQEAVTERERLLG